MKKFNRAEADDQAVRRGSLIPADFVAGAQWMSQQPCTACESRRSKMNDRARKVRQTERYRTYMREYMREWMRKKRKAMADGAE